MLAASAGGWPGLPASLHSIRRSKVISSQTPTFNAHPSERCHASRTRTIFCGEVMGTQRTPRTPQERARFARLLQDGAQHAQRLRRRRQQRRQVPCGRGWDHVPWGSTPKRQLRTHLRPLQSPPAVPAPPHLAFPASIQSSIPSFIHSFVRSFVHSFVHAFIVRSFIHSSFVRSFMHSFVRSFVLHSTALLLLQQQQPHNWMLQMRRPTLLAASETPHQGTDLLLLGCWIPPSQGEQLRHRFHRHGCGGGTRGRGRGCNVEKCADNASGRR